MPKGPQGRKRQTGVVGGAVNVGRIAAGEIEQTQVPVKSAAAAFGSPGRKGAGGCLVQAQTQGNCAQGGQKTLQSPLP